MYTLVYGRTSIGRLESVVNLIKRFTIVIYDSSVVLTRKMHKLLLLGRNLRL